MPKPIAEMKISELIAFAEQQAAIELENASAATTDSGQRTSWAATLEMLKLMKERGVPESLQG